MDYPVLATQLAIYLADCLDTNGVKTRTAKTLHHLIRKGSRQFRKALRTEKDEILRKGANSSDPLVAKIVTESRKILFDEDLISRDDQISEEIPPQPILSGMGASSGMVIFLIDFSNADVKLIDFCMKSDTTRVLKH